MLSYKPMEPVQFRLGQQHDDLHLITSTGKSLRPNPAQLPAPHELTPEPTPIPTPSISTPDEGPEEDLDKRAQAIRDAVSRRNALDSSADADGSAVPDCAPAASVGARVPSDDDPCADACLAYPIQITDILSVFFYTR